MANRPALHDDDWVMPVFALRRCGQAGDVTPIHLSENLLETYGGKVMALVHNDVTIVGDHIVHDLFAIQALNNGHINHPAVIPATAADLADAFYW